MVTIVINKNVINIANIKNNIMITINNHHHFPELILVRAVAHLAVKVNHVDFEATFFTGGQDDNEDYEREKPPLHLRCAKPSQCPQMSI